MKPTIRVLFLLAPLLARCALAPLPAAAQRTFRIVRDTATLTVGDTLRLHFAATDGRGRAVQAPAAYCGSFAPAVVRSDDAGLIAVAPGTARVACAWYTEIDTLTLTVAARPAPPPDPDTDPAPPTHPARVLEVLPASATVGVGATVTLEARMREPAGVFGCTQCAWRSSDPAVAAVSGSGTRVTVTGRAAGTATITATSQHPVSGSAVVTVSGQAPQQPQQPSPPPPNPDPPAAPGTWPDNEPSGFTRILHVKGDTKDWGSGFNYGSAWLDDNRVRVVSDPASKYGKAIEKRFFAGDDSGWHGHANQNDWPGSYREIYFRAVIMFSPNYQFHAAADKLWYWGREAQGSATEFYIAVRGNVGGQIEVAWGGSDGPRDFRHVSGPRIERGRYHTIELYLVANSAGDVKDGRGRVWLDGIEITSWRCDGKGFGCPDHPNGAPMVNVPWFRPDMGTIGWDGIQSFLYWGGSGDTKRVDDWLRISEFYISGR